MTSVFFGAAVGLWGAVYSTIEMIALIILFRRTGHGAQWCLWALMPVSAFFTSGIFNALIVGELVIEREQTMWVAFASQVVTGVLGLSGFLVLTWRIWAGYGVLKPAR
ncbi:hypothetical protein [Pseudaestuariivita rosea]|uniref:hypothetical protein n=1 Tax=Pseudaestuariivita rosea TaxID=2763263 RepID=UPI001ABA6B73|nr:hypothetical protein [Pseudaestuariivita rosea]